jgi:anti-anti-sigma regulatory factor
MLRISVLNTPGTTRMKLEGKLAHEWVQEAAKAWSALLAMNERTAIIVDLLNVSFVDDAGHELLAAMRHADAELIGCGPMMSALIDEIEETEATTDATDWDCPEIDEIGRK